jgi:ubiquinone/menaquinone biosynthesis C-methylase UbiE
MKKLNLLKSLPQSKRKVEKRSSSKTQENIRISRQYSFDYFDGKREFGYGGYNYDGRWVPVAKDIINFFQLKKTSKILDVGCAKGFLIYDLKNLDMEVYGLDISEYAKKNSLKEVSGQITIGNAKKLPYDSNYFDLVLSINTIHNLKKNECCEAIKELSRVAKNKKNIFIQVDSYETKKQKEVFESWVLTAKYHGYTYEWEHLFNKCGYKGYYFWTIIK